MVTNTEVNDNSNEEIIEDLTPPDTSSDDILDSPSTNDDAGAGVTDDTPVDSVNPTDTSSAILTETPPEPPTAPQQPPIDQRSLQELNQLRAANAEKAWRDQLGQQARAYEQELNTRGYLPEQARDQARRFIQGQQQTRKQQQ